MANRPRGKRVSSAKARSSPPAAPPAASGQNRSQMNIDKKTREATSKVIKYIDDFRSANDIKALQEEGYEIDYDRLVGVGSNSAVFLAHSVTSQPPPLDKNGQRPLYTPGYDVAVKVVVKKWIDSKRPLKTRTGNLKLALALGRTDPENNILKVIDVFKTPERIFIFMQYCAYGNVISFIRRNGNVPSRLAQRWSAQMAISLAFLHKFHIAHRNYKLENVLIDDNLNAKLTGFGLSKFCVDLQTKQQLLSRTICGSEPYLAPEMLREAAERYYDPKEADVWAFGVGIFLCVTKRYPFEADSLRALKAEQLNCRYLERDTKKRIKGPIKKLLDMIFVIDPIARARMDDICQRSVWLNINLAQNNEAQQEMSKQASSKASKMARTRARTPARAITPSQGFSSQRSNASGATTGPPISPSNSPANSRSPGQRPGPSSSGLRRDVANSARTDGKLTPVTPRAFQTDDVIPFSSQQNANRSNT